MRIDKWVLSDSQMVFKRGGTFFLMAKLERDLGVTLWLFNITMENGP